MDLIFNREVNSIGRKDATGAFIPEAKALAALLTAQDRTVRRFAAMSPKTFNALAHIRAGQKVDSINIFCHGWRTGCELLPKGDVGARELAPLLKAKGVKLLNLFACSTAEPNEKGNYSLWVSEACKDLGHNIQVFGHETAGHTTKNPRIRVYWPDGRWVAVDSVDDRKGFASELKSNPNYRLLLPFRMYGM